MAKKKRKAKNVPLKAKKPAKRKKKGANKVNRYIAINTAIAA